MMTELSVNHVKDMTYIVMGSSKSNKNSNIIARLLGSMGVHILNKEMIDDLLQLFMVLFLKSEEVVKVAFLQDLTEIFQALKETETKIFVDKKFSYKFLFFNTLQFIHCLK